MELEARVGAKNPTGRPVPKVCRPTVAASLLAMALANGAARAQVPAAGVETASAGPDAAVHAFHAALESGDGAAAMTLLAPDAVILEEGDRELREHYEAHHLSADITFAKAVPSVRRDEQVMVSGNAAWVSATSESRGRFRDHAVHLEGAELMVLTRSEAGWTIRAIHWSSHKAE